MIIIQVLNFMLTCFVAIGTVYLIQSIQKCNTLNINNKEDDRTLIEKLDEIFLEKL